MTCNRKDICYNYPKDCQLCQITSDVMNNYPCFQDKKMFEVEKKENNIDNSHIEEILSNGKRCLEIFFGERHEEECLQCPYKDKGVDCVFYLIAEQEKILNQYSKKDEGGKNDGL